MFAYPNNKTSGAIDNFTKENVSSPTANSTKPVNNSINPAINSFFDIFISFINLILTNSTRHFLKVQCLVKIISKKTYKLNFQLPLT